MHPVQKNCVSIEITVSVSATVPMREVNSLERKSTRVDSKEDLVCTLFATV